VEGLLAVVGLEVTTESIRTGTGTERWRERVPDVWGCNSEAASAKWLLVTSYIKYKLALKSCSNLRLGVRRYRAHNTQFSHVVHNVKQR